PRQRQPDRQGPRLPHPQGGRHAGQHPRPATGRPARQRAELQRHRGDQGDPDAAVSRGPAKARPIMSTRTVCWLGGALVLAFLVFRAHAVAEARTLAVDEEKAQLEAQLKALQKETDVLQAAIKALRDRERDAALRAQVALDRERQRAEELERQKRELE